MTMAYRNLKTTPFHTLATVLLILVLGLLGASSARAEYRDIPPEKMPNVQSQDRMRFVSDPDGLLRRSTRDRIDTMLGALRDSTTVEVAVAIVPSLGDLTPEEYSEKLFTSWGIGKADKDNGVLILISPGSRRARIETGYGVEGVIPDAVAGQIIDRAIVPAMQGDDIDAAAFGAAAMTAKILADPENAGELRSSQKGSKAESPLDSDVIWQAIGFVALACWVAMGVIVMLTLMKTRRASTYQAALTWRRQLWLLWVLTALSLGTGLVWSLWAWWRYRRNRNHSRKCCRCGSKMEKLDEEADNAYLQPWEDLEERLGTVDYDVWRCGNCGEVERFGFNEKQDKYTACPKCGTVAYHKVCDRMTVPPTTRLAGEGVRQYHCEYCGYDRNDRYTIPKKDDAAVAAAALGAAALSSRRGHIGRGSGFGGFGGGFGGGSTGGGGATGSW